MRERLVGEAWCLKSRARYYVLEDESEDGGSFGVRIEFEEETAAVPDLSPSRRRVMELAEALVRGGVTPTGLRDVVDDWLLE